MNPLSPSTEKSETPATPTAPAFESFLSHPHLLKNLKEVMGFPAATPIQAAVAPAVLAGKNLFAGAKTGSGKTIAFLAPVAERLLKNEVRMALVLAPTRELVLQIDEEAAKLLDGQTAVVSVPLYGGVPADPQILALKHHKPRMIIATPGRTLDLVQEGVLNLAQVDISILDEADRMCDMGFAPQVTEILDLCVENKQMLLFSATLPEQLTGVMDKFCKDPVRIQVDASDKSSETITHTAVFCNRRNKLDKLLDIVDPEDVTSLIFTRTRIGADRLFRSLQQNVRSTGILHAGFSMGDRERTIRQFREGGFRLLVATDVAARGIDVDRITHVIHYDLPDALEDYIHRSGRSGRAGRNGVTLAMIEQDSRDQMDKFKLFQGKINFLNPDGSPLRKEDVPSLEAGSDDRPSSRGGRGGRRPAQNDRPRRGPGENAQQQGSSPSSRPTESYSGNRQGGRPPADRGKRPPSRSPRRDSPRSKPSAPSSASPAKKGALAKTKSWIKGLFQRPKKP